MYTIRFRQVVALLVLTLFAAGLVAATVRVGGLVFGAGSAVAVEAPADLGLPESLAFPAVEWVEPGAMSELVQDRVAAAYQEAWVELERVQSGGEAGDLDRFFTGPALAFVTNEVETGGGGLIVEPGFHRLVPSYVHPEEWLVGFTDRDLAVRRSLGDVTTETVESYEVVMVIERGRWMIHSMRRTVDDAG